MAYNALSVAKFIVNYCYEQGKPISNLKLQKLLYFSWIDYYKEKHNFLYGDKISAWQFGPVITEVYYDYCIYAGTPIRRTYESEIHPSDASILEKIIDKYIDFSVGTLVSLTHRNGKPWDVVYQNGKGLRQIIPFSLIKELECDSYC